MENAITHQLPHVFQGNIIRVKTTFSCSMYVESENWPKEIVTDVTNFVTCMTW